MVHFLPHFLSLSFPHKVADRPKRKGHKVMDILDACNAKEMLTKLADGDMAIGIRQINAHCIVYWGFWMSDWLCCFHGEGGPPAQCWRTATIVDFSTSRCRNKSLVSIWMQERISVHKGTKVKGGLLVNNKAILDHVETQRSIGAWHSQAWVHKQASTWGQGLEAKVSSGEIKSFMVNFGNLLNKTSNRMWGVGDWVGKEAGDEAKNYLQLT